MRSSRTFPWSVALTSESRPLVGRVATSAILCLAMSACSGAGATTPGASATASPSAPSTVTASGSIALPSPTMAHDSYRVIARIVDSSRLTATVLVADGRILLVDDHMAAQMFDATLGSSKVFPSSQADRYNYSVTRLPDGRVQVIGGTDGIDLPLTTLIFDPTSGTWAESGPLAAAREDHTATTLTDGRVLVVGGDRWSGGSGPFLVSSEIYDPTTATFSATGSLHHPRTLHAATRLHDGRVLVTGGSSGSSAPNAAELYDPNTGVFKLTGSMRTGRTRHTATLLEDGRVLIAGGNDGFTLASAEIYDPLTGRFTETGSMTSPRAGGAGVLLADGRVLVVGEGAPGELYDPATGTFRATAPMPAGLSGSLASRDSATLLPNGQVLLLLSGIDATATPQQIQFLVVYQP
jgi:hypothetical protein